jgi:hypothetical protein
LERGRDESDVLQSTNQGRLTRWYRNCNEGACIGIVWSLEEEIAVFVWTSWHIEVQVMVLRSYFQVSSHFDADADAGEAVRRLLTRRGGD